MVKLSTVPICGRLGGSLGGMPLAGSLQDLDADGSLYSTRPVSECQRLNGDNKNGDTPKRRHSKTATTKTATLQNGDNSGKNGDNSSQNDDNH